MTDGGSRRNERYDYIDYAKAVAIFLIGIGHFLPNGSFARVALYSFHVPVFFFIAGYLYRYEPKTNLRMWFRSKVRRILVPYLLLFSLSLSVVFLQNGARGVLKAVTENLFFIRGSMLWNSALWFLPVYFLCVVSFQLFNMAVKGRVAATAILGIACIISTVLIDKNDLYAFRIFGINKCLCMLPFICLGYVVRQYRLIDAVIGTRAQNSRAAFMGALFLGLLLSAGAINNGDNISILGNDYNNVLLFFPFAMALSFSFVAMFFTLKPGYLVRLVSSNTIFYMGTHLFFRFAYKRIFQTDTLIYTLYGACVFAVYVMFFVLYSQVVSRHKKLAGFGECFGLFCIPYNRDQPVTSSEMMLHTNRGAI